MLADPVMIFAIIVVLAFLLLFVVYPLCTILTQSFTTDDSPYTNAVNQSGRALVSLANGDEALMQSPYYRLGEAAVAMVAHPDFKGGKLSTLEYQRLRIRFDFEYWCARATKIKDKRTHREVPFVLNRAQCILLKALEDRRMAGKPVRVILLKARQWGGSTLVQYYMAWWQLVLYRGCNSLIAGHRKDNAITIRNLYKRLLENYPTRFQQ